MTGYPGRNRLASMALIAAATACAAVVAVTEPKKAKEPEAAPRQDPVFNPQSPAPVRQKMTVEEAMQRTGTTSPKAALAKLNEGLVGRRRFSYMPHTGERARKRYLRQLEKERAREASKVTAPA